jgi:hypothetical protein
MSAVAKLLFKFGEKELKYEFANGESMILTMASLKEVHSHNIATGTIRSISEHSRYKNELAYQFDLDDVVRISNPVTSVVLYERQIGAVELVDS